VTVLTSENPSEFINYRSLRVPATLDVFLGPLASSISMVEGSSTSIEHPEACIVAITSISIFSELPGLPNTSGASGTLWSLPVLLRGLPVTPDGFPMASHGFPMVSEGLWLLSEGFLQRVLMFLQPPIVLAMTLLPIMRRVS